MAGLEIPEDLDLTNLDEKRKSKLKKKKTKKT